MRVSIMRVCNTIFADREKSLLITAGHQELLQSTVVMVSDSVVGNGSSPREPRCSLVFPGMYHCCLCCIDLKDVLCR